MARVSAYPMVQVGEALETILAYAEPLDVETVELTKARARILAGDVAADATGVRHARRRVIATLHHHEGAASVAACEGHPLAGRG